MPLESGRLVTYHDENLNEKSHAVEYPFGSIGQRHFVIDENLDHRGPYESDEHANVMRVLQIEKKMIVAFVTKYAVV